MSTRSHVPSKITAALAILFLLPSLIFFVIWTSVGLRNSDMTLTDKTDTFLGHLPGFLNDMLTVHIVAFVCCVVTIILASRSFKKRLVSLRVVMLITVLLSIFLILFNFSQVI